MPISVFEGTYGVSLPELINRWDYAKFIHRLCALQVSSVQDTITLTSPDDRDAYSSRRRIYVAWIATCVSSA
jgi:hypothetical protein